MRRLFLAAALCAAAAVASAQFEGIAEFKAVTNMEQGKPVPSTARMFLTKSAYRLEWETDTSTIAEGKRGKTSVPAHVKMTMVSRLADPDKLYMINDQNKSYSVTDLKKIREEAGGVRDKETYTVQKLGSDAVAGISCQKVLLTSSKGTEVEICISKEIAASSQWISAMNRRQGDSSSWLKVLKEKGVEGFPVRWSIRHKGAKEATMIMELTRLEKKPLPGSLFEVPAGYKESDFAMGGLTPEQERTMADAKAKMNEALEEMTPEERKAYEDAMKKYGQPRPTPQP
ncbi:MAG TPA: DUF4412 domain-containing protein [Thermoanaerobaculia bacterium]|jgi:hypothetical protein